MLRYFHGLSKKRSFVEGWYFKHTRDHNLFTIIPGIHIDHIGRRFAFIEVITTTQCYYIPYPFSAFEANKKQLDIQIGENHFSSKGIRLFINTDNLSLKGAIHYEQHITMPDEIAGPFCLLPFTKCHSGIISASHNTSGYLKFNGELINFDNGKGYIETDWGCSFSRRYLWTQCNYFDDAPHCSIVILATHTGFLSNTFIGCLGIITYHEHTYYFASQLGAKLTHLSGQGFILYQGNYSLEVILLEQHNLCTPLALRGDMTTIIHACTKCTVRYRLKAQNNVLFDLISTHAGYEFAL